MLRPSYARLSVTVFIGQNKTLAGSVYVTSVHTAE
jgi:hypothetical protein